MEEEPIVDHNLLQSAAGLPQHNYWLQSVCEATAAGPGLQLPPTRFAIMITYGLQPAAIGQPSKFKVEANMHLHEVTISLHSMQMHVSFYFEFGRLSYCSRL